MKKMAVRAPRFHVGIALLPGAEIELTKGAARHCAVLRLRRGDPVAVFNGNGGEFAAELTLLSGGAARARILAHRPQERESPLRITLAQCVSTGDRMDFVVQKATELGVSKIVPIESERSIVRLSRDRAERRVMHWRNVAVAACEQCGRNRIPEITAITDLQTYLTDPDDGATHLLLDPESGRDLKGLGSPLSSVLLVGPEGGLTPEEQVDAERGGFLTVRFGPRLLRTETAPLAAIAAMQVIWGDC